MFTHRFNPLSLEKTISLKEPVDGDLLMSMKEGGVSNLTGVPQRPTQENDAIPRVAPKWLKHDRQVSVRFEVARGGRQMPRGGPSVGCPLCTILFIIAQWESHALIIDDAGCNCSHVQWLSLFHQDSNQVFFAGRFIPAPYFCLNLLSCHALLTVAFDNRC